MLTEIKNNYPIIKKLYDDRVCDFIPASDKTGLIMHERCDEWFFSNLSKEDCLQLADFFVEIAENYEQLTIESEEMELI